MSFKEWATRVLCGEPGSDPLRKSFIHKVLDILPGEPNLEPMRVLFEVECRATKVGEAVYVCGSAPELGEWASDRAVRLHTNARLYPLWVGSVSVRHRTGVEALEFKFGIGPEASPIPFRWERGENRSLAVAGAGAGRVLSARAAYEAGGVDAGPPPEPQSLRVGTFNVRYANEGDRHGWRERCPCVVAVVRALRLDAVGFQEVLPAQLDDLAAALPEYAVFAFGRDDGARGGEASPVFVRSDRLSILQTRKAWLSESPSGPGKGWDAALPRIASIALLYDHATRRLFSFTSTHLDHLGDVARVEGARLLCRLAQAAGVPGFVVGDFNAAPNSPAHRAMLEGGFSEARAVSGTEVEGPGYSFVGFPGESDGWREMIDYVFASAETRVLAAVVAEAPAAQQPVPPSDHFAVAAEVLVA
eukprot:tig00001466_g8781.t1